jgi:hypothetical protein
MRRSFLEKSVHHEMVIASVEATVFASEYPYIWRNLLEAEADSVKGGATIFDRLLYFCAFTVSDTNDYSIVIPAKHWKKVHGWNPGSAPGSIRMRIAIHRSLTHANGKGITHVARWEWESIRKWRRQGSRFFLSFRIAAAGLMQRRAAAVARGPAAWNRRRVL